LRVLLLELGPTVALVVEGALVLVGVAVQSTEEVLASALETSESHFLLAGKASVSTLGGRLPLVFWGRDGELRAGRTG